MESVVLPRARWVAKRGKGTVPRETLEAQSIRVQRDIDARLLKLLRAKGVNKTKLAKRLGTSKAHVTQFFKRRKHISGETQSRMLLISSIIEMYAALGREIVIVDRPLGAKPRTAKGRRKRTPTRRYLCLSETNTT